jgi:beta-lactam-binding protein with PASTA domain
VEIPNVLGESQRAAQINILRRGLDVGAVAQIEMPSAPADQVLGQSPPPNASGIAAPKISLLTTESPSPQAFLMPNFAGQSLGGATLVLQDAGFRLGNVNVAPSATPPPVPSPDSSAAIAPVSPAPSEPTPASVIVSQNPAPGAKVVSGSAVNFEVR